MKKITLFICLLAMSIASAQLNSVALIGSGVGGWPGDPGNPGPEDLHQMVTTDNVHWTYDNLPVSASTIKLRGNNAWTLPYNWGITSFPNGTAVIDGGGADGVPGVYDVTFNSTTGDYTFTLDTSLFPTISLIGPAAGSWDTDIDLVTTDGIVYSANNLHLMAGAVKWREAHTWSATTNWGPGVGNETHLVGTAVLNHDGAVTIPTEGNYNVSFNKNTLAYSFAFPKVAIVGSATPAGWPTNAPGEIDALALTTTDGMNYSLGSVALTSGTDIALKFRADNSWSRQWGATTPPGFPSGVGIQTGGDIKPDVAGNYSVSLNTITGAYNFAAPLATAQFNTNSFKVYPNPTTSSWNFSASNERIESIQIVDVTGKTVITASPKSNEAAINASGLSSGVYFAKVSTASASNTIKLVKN